MDWLNKSGHSLTGVCRFKPKGFPSGECKGRMLRKAPPARSFRYIRQPADTQRPDGASDDFLRGFFAGLRGESFGRNESEAGLCLSQVRKEGKKQSDQVSMSPNGAKCL